MHAERHAAREASRGLWSTFHGNVLEQALRDTLQAPASHRRDRGAVSVGVRRRTRARRLLF
eukprot:7940445-Pyramimonas_sp.AAC.1